MIEEAFPRRQLFDPRALDQDLLRFMKSRGRLNVSRVPGVQDNPFEAQAYIATKITTWPDLSLRDIERLMAYLIDINQSQGCTWMKGGYNYKGVPMDPAEDEKAILAARKKILDRLETDTPNLTDEDDYNAYMTIFWWTLPGAEQFPPSWITRLQLYRKFKTYDLTDILGMEGWNIRNPEYQRQNRSDVVKYVKDKVGKMVKAIEKEPGYRTRYGLQ